MLRAVIRPNCPAPKPIERRASVTAATRSRYPFQVRERHSPDSFQCSAGWSPPLTTASANRVQTVLPDTFLSMSFRSAMTSMAGNTLLAGGAGLIYVRSRRSIVTLAAVGLISALAFAGLAAAAMALPGGWVAGLPLAVGALGGLVFAAWAGWRLWAWPSSKLGFFRDPLVPIPGPPQMPPVRAR